MILKTLCGHFLSLTNLKLLLFLLIFISILLLNFNAASKVSNTTMIRNSPIAIYNNFVLLVAFIFVFLVPILDHKMVRLNEKFAVLIILFVLCYIMLLFLFLSGFMLYKWPLICLIYFLLKYKIFILLLLVYIINFLFILIFVFLDFYVFLLFYQCPVINCTLVLHLVFSLDIRLIIEVTNALTWKLIKFTNASIVNPMFSDCSSLAHYWRLSPPTLLL